MGTQPAEPLAATLVGRLRTEDLADGGDHLAAQRDDRIEGVGLASGELVGGFGREKRIEPLNALDFSPHAQCFSWAVRRGRLEGDINSNNILLPDRLVGERKAKSRLVLSPMSLQRVGFRLLCRRMSSRAMFAPSPPIAPNVGPKEPVAVRHIDGIYAHPAHLRVAELAGHQART